MTGFCAFCIYQEMTDGSLNTAMHSVMVLCLTSCDPTLDVDVGILQFLPSLEKLYITVTVCINSFWFSIIPLVSYIAGLILSFYLLDRSYSF